MKHLIFWAVVLLAAPALAQDKPAPQEPAKPEAKKQASTASKKHKRWTEDARHCLQLPTNTEIIKCAEEYL
jgi:hypothetical protein